MLQTLYLTYSRSLDTLSALPVVSKELKTEHRIQGVPSTVSITGGNLFSGRVILIISDRGQYALGHLDTLLGHKEEIVSLWFN